MVNNSYRDRHKNRGELLNRVAQSDGARCYFRTNQFSNDGS